MKIHFLPIILLLTMRGIAAAEESGFYLKGSTGPAFLSDLRVHYGSLFSSTFEIRSETGVRSDLVAGYSFSEFVSAEVNSGLIWNELETAIPTHYYQIPAMINGLAHYPIGSWRATVGGGLGAMGIIADYEGIGENSSGTAFAAQGIAGLEYQLNARCSVELGYKFLYVAPFKIERHIELGPALTHTVSLGIAFRF